MLTNMTVKQINSIIKTYIAGTGGDITDDNLDELQIFFDLRNVFAQVETDEEDK